MASPEGSTANHSEEAKWKAIGASTTTPVEHTERKEVEVSDRYYVVIGFEVNNPAAFKEETQDLAIDYGHAFFYLVKNNIITHVFSFGPNGLGNVGWFNRGNRAQGQPNIYDTGAVIKDGYSNARPATTDYGITEPVKAFKTTLTKKQAEDLEKKVAQFRKKIADGKQKYTAYINDTCAETARDILSDSGIETPSGRGKIKHSGMINFPIAYAVNPYNWHHNFKDAKFREVSYTPSTPSGRRVWLPPIGNTDPMFSADVSDK